MYIAKSFGYDNMSKKITNLLIIDLSHHKISVASASLPVIYGSFTCILGKIDFYYSPFYLVKVLDLSMKEVCRLEERSTKQTKQTNQCSFILKSDLNLIALLRHFPETAKDNVK